MFSSSQVRKHADIWKMKRTKLTCRDTINDYYHRRHVFNLVKLTINIFESSSNLFFDCFFDNCARKQQFRCIISSCA